MDRRSYQMTSCGSILRSRQSPQDADIHGVRSSVSGRENAQCRCGISPFVTALGQPSGAKIDHRRGDERVQRRLAWLGWYRYLTCQVSENVDAFTSPVGPDPAGIGITACGNQAWSLNNEPA